MKKVLLTGVNGFTGKYVAKELTEKGYQVIGFVNKYAGEFQMACDLTDKQAVKNCLVEVKPDYVIHLGALSFVGVCISELLRC